MSIFPLESKSETSRVRIGMIAYGKELMLSDLFSFFPTEQAGLATFCFS